MTHACRAESQAASDVAEDLASVLAEGIAKLLLHACHWSSSSSKGLQVGTHGTQLCALHTQHVTACSGTFAVFSSTLTTQCF